MPNSFSRQLWQESGRWERTARNCCVLRTGMKGILSWPDRRGNYHRYRASNVRVYRELPFNLYQIQTKFRR